MKKSMILVLAIVVLFVGAAAAYANTTSSYVAWSSAFPNNNVSNPTPHKDYTVGTQRCEVCHAVHRATPTGELLLRSTAGDACTYCHIDSPVGNIRVYDSVPSNYTNDVTRTAFDGGFAHDSAGGVECIDCHAVHGARTLAGSLSSKILKDWSSWATTEFQVYSTLATARWSDPKNVSGDKYGQETAWCTGCHKYYIGTYDASQTWTVQSSLVGNSASSNSWVAFGSHVMTITHTNYNQGIDNGASIAPTQVAWAPSDTCRACHNAGQVDTAGGNVQSSFPHYTPNYYRFMTVGASVGASTSTNSTGTVDGLCLKCHVNDTSTLGIGISF